MELETRSEYRRRTRRLVYPRCIDCGHEIRDERCYALGIGEYACNACVNRRLSELENSDISDMAYEMMEAALDAAWSYTPVEEWEETA